MTDKEALAWVAHRAIACLRDPPYEDGDKDYNDGVRPVRRRGGDARDDASGADLVPVRHVTAAGAAGRLAVRRRRPAACYRADIREVKLHRLRRRLDDARVRWLCCERGRCVKPETKIRQAPEHFRCYWAFDGMKDLMDYADEAGRDVELLFEHREPGVWELRMRTVPRNERKREINLPPIAVVS